MSSSFFSFFLLLPPPPPSSSYYCKWLHYCQLIPKSFYFFLTLPSPFPSCFPVHLSGPGEFWTQPHLGQALDQFSLLTKAQACPPAPGPQIAVHILPAICGTNLGVLISSLPCKWMTGCFPQKISEWGSQPLRNQKPGWSSEPVRPCSRAPPALLKEEALRQQLFRAGTFSFCLSVEAKVQTLLLGIYPPDVFPS